SACLHQGRDRRSFGPPLALRPGLHSRPRLPTPCRRAGQRAHSSAPDRTANLDARLCRTTKEERPVEALLPGLIIGTIFVFFMYIVGASRRPDLSRSSLPRDRVTFDVIAPRELVQNAILAYSQTSGLNIEQIDPSGNMVILGENLSLAKNHNGFWL